jgi:hypothetical protein
METDTKDEISRTRKGDLTIEENERNGSIGGECDIVWFIIVTSL